MLEGPPLMHVDRLRLSGWKCFREEQVLDLRPVPYAIVARYEDDPERSNWAGKTSLLQAVDWALYGRLPDDAEGKDAVITRGESKVEVTLELSSGARVVRSKERNRPERLWFWPSATSEPERPASMKDEAQMGIVRALGLDGIDFVNTSYFRQREMARFVLQDPAERLATVSGWLRLGPLERAEELARTRLGSALAASETAERSIRMAQDQEAAAIASLAQLLEGYSGSADEALVQIEVAVESVRDEIAHAETRLGESREREFLEKQARAYLEVVEEGKKLVASLPSEEATSDLACRELVLKGALDEASAAFSVAHEDSLQKKRLVVEGFSGQCPVVGSPCPSAAWVAERGDQSRALYDEARAREEETVKAKREAEEEYVEARNAVLRVDRLREQVEGLRATALKLQPAYVRAKSLPREDVFADDIPALRRQEQLLVHRLVEVKHQRHLLTEARRCATVFAERVEEARREVAAAREAVLVFGKTGAQRRVAERALDRIGAGATSMLAEAGVPLSVSLRWSREGKGLASHCPDCGSPFPSSARVKECERCAAPRGPKLVHQLDVVLSDRSGAAEDLAAFALQMSASAWLRRERAAAWSVLLLDEPTSALDASNRRALTAHLSRLFAYSGITQAFVVAHHASVLESLPGRIEIVAGSGGSRATVVA